jgi:hypothetical protein
VALPPTVRTAIEQLTQQSAQPGPATLQGGQAALYQRVPVKLLGNEQLLMVVRRHWIVLARKEVWPLVLLVLGVGGAALASLFGGARVSQFAVVLALACLLPGLLWGALAYLDYADDFFVLTTERIIDIDRRFFILAEARKETTFDKIQDVRVNISAPGRVIGYGSLTVETAGRLPDIEMTYVPHAFAVQDLIFARITATKAPKQAPDAATQRQEYAHMMATALGQIVVEVPSVRGLLVLPAGERLRAAGLRLVVDFQQPVQGILPGTVIAQMPQEGSVAMRGTEVRVVLSARAAQAASPGTRGGPGAPLRPAMP